MAAVGASRGSIATEPTLNFLAHQSPLTLRDCEAYEVSRIASIIGKTKAPIGLSHTTVH